MVRTAVFGAANLGSNPSAPASKTAGQTPCLVSDLFFDSTEECCHDSIVRAIYPIIESVELGGLAYAEGN